MGAVELGIYRLVDGTKTLVAKADKWKFQDAVMGEQFITCTVTSEVPIDWSVGDYCEFRGETYTLNYIPAVTQKAPSNSVQDAYTYENIRLDSMQDELTRCMMLDVTPTTPEYQAVLGTNHTGSSRFQLYCGETTVNGATLTAVCALALKMQANLDRLYPGAWHIYVDTVSTYETPSGETVLVTHTDSKLLTFDNMTVAQALGMVHTEFKLDYCVRGRNIYIGYSVDSIDPEHHPITDITSDNASGKFAFGYGRGYPDVDNPGKGLFQIKQVANSQQKIVTRLRALGSTKNLPYNYYFKKYRLLSQALFPNNLQLPGTFLPIGLPSDAADADGSTKWAQNNARNPYLRKVLGDTNDSYIDKNDDAESCVEGIREDCARWDGSNGDLPEIYPTIEGVTFGELRNAGVPDQTGETGATAYQGNKIQPDYERIDNLLAVGYTDNGVLIDDANIGDGIMPENEVVDTGTHFVVGIGQSKLTYNPQSEKGDFDYESIYLEGEQRELFTVHDVTPGSYFMVPTGPSYSPVAYRFSLSAKESASANVGFIIRVKQVVNGVSSTIAEWVSPLVPTSESSGEQEMYLPEIPDGATSGQVGSLTVTENCDVLVTFAPIIDEVSSSGQVTLTYIVGRSKSGEYDPEYNWGAVQGDPASKYPFHVFIKDMGFDLTATFNGDTPIMAMRSGACVGREFEIGKNVQRAVVNGKRGYLLTLNRVEDSNLHTYYPNESYPIAAGDYFVLLGINMPDAYIRAAELRLLAAATEYLADNCETKYTYQPSIDDIYLQRNIDENELAGTPEKSVFWRLYAGLRFTFNGIPSSEGGQLPLVNMTIEKVTISIGEGLTPKVDIVLNDDVQQTTLQKLTVAVDRIYNGSAFATGGAGTSMEAIADIGSRLFLSRTHDDTASGRITFNNIATFLELVKAKNGINIGEYLPGFLGAGASIGADGRSEFEEVSIRGALRAAEIVFNLIRAEGGERIESIGNGEILTVDEENMVATLKLDGDTWATIDEGDICRGLYNTIDKDYTNDTTGQDANGFRTEQGFFASYFKVEEILVNKRGECSFRYSLQTDGQGNVITEHPCPLMKFAAYGNDDPTKPERQSCIYTTAVGIAPRQLYLAHVNDWAIRPENIKIAKGNIEGLQVNEKNADGTTSLKTLHGDAGFFVEDNIYFGGILNQFTAADWEYIQDKLGQGIHAQLLRGSDNIVVDALGNVVGGLYEESTDGNTVTHHYKLHTGVLVYDSGKGRYLKLGEAGNLADDEFAMYVTANGCTVLQDGSDIYITSIDNTANGVVLNDTQLEAMRQTEGFSVDFVIVTANGWRTMMSYPVKITHLDYSYISFDLTNEMDSMSYRTQLKSYVGLPLSTQLKAFANGVELSSDAFVSSSMTSTAFSGTATATNDLLPAVKWFGDTASNSVKAALSKSGLLTISQNGRNAVDMEDAKYEFDISCVVKYAGVRYTSPAKRFVLAETTDATLYKLLLSANAVSKDEGVYTPATIDVKVQIIDNSGVSIKSANEMAGDVKVFYVNGIYNENAQLLTAMPEFDQVPVCVTVVLMDTSSNTVLDIESVPMTAVGRNGAGQPWVSTNYETVYIDCDSDGKVLGDPATFIISASLYWGDTPCTLDVSSCAIGFVDSEDDTPDQQSSPQGIVKRFSIAKGTVFSTSYVTMYLYGLDGDGGAHSATKTIPVVANVKGKDGAKGDSGAGLLFIGEWKANIGYTWDSNIRNAVHHDSMYWLVNVACVDQLLGEPTLENNNWLAVSTLKFTATDLLLAANASIDLLSSNVINLFNGNTKTASINADGFGSYCIYYPSGNKRMELSYEGFWYYYNDDNGNTLAWYIGHGGDITRSKSDDWEPMWLTEVSESVTFDGNTSYNDSNRKNYWRFNAGTGSQFSAQNEMIYTVKPSNNNPATNVDNIIADGWYTPNVTPFHKINDDGDAMIYQITLYHIVSGRIYRTYTRTRNTDGTYINEL